jgi:hypothetical protein
MTPTDVGDDGMLLLQGLSESEAPLDMLTLSSAGEGSHLVSSGFPGGANEAEVKIDLEVPHPFAARTAGGVASGREPRSYGRRGEDADGPSRPRSKFFGTVAYGDRFVYVLDKSGSMGEGRNLSRGSRFERARAELVRSIDELAEDQRFCVFLFSHETRQMFDAEWLVPQLLPATPGNKRKLKAWLATIDPGGNTDPREALRLGLALEPSAIFLLSDGAFNGREKSLNVGLFTGNPDVSAVVERHNRAQSPIHTFAYEDPDSCEQMAALAEQTKGRYRYIPAPGLDAPERGHASSERRRPTGPDSQLAMAKALESLGRMRPALERYQQIASEFPGTSAAAEALQRAELILSNQRP